MPVKKGAGIAPAKGKLGVLLVGLGAVSTTFIAGVEAIKEGFAEPIGSLTQMGTIRLGKRTDNRVPAIKDFVPLAGLDDLVFGAWDIFPDSAYDAAMHAGVLEKELLAKLKKPLQKIKPMKAVFDQEYVKRLSGTNVKRGKNKLELANQLIEEIAEFKRRHKCARLVMIWAASTEIFLKPHAVHRDLTETMQSLVGLFRNREDLESGLAKIREFRDRWDRIRVEGSRLFNPGWHLARDLKAMLTVSEAVARSALRREESRGAHSRTDFARSDPTWGKKNIVVKRVGGAMELSERPVPEPPPDLKTILEAP